MAQTRGNNACIAAQQQQRRAGCQRCNVAVAQRNRKIVVREPGTVSCAGMCVGRQPEPVTRTKSAGSGGGRGAVSEQQALGWREQPVGSRPCGTKRTTVVSTGVSDNNVCCATVGGRYTGEETVRSAGTMGNARAKNRG